MSSELATKDCVRAEINAFRAEVKRRFERVEADIQELKTNVQGLKTDVGEMKITMAEMQITMRQIDIRARNGKLKNPITRIRPIPVFIQGRGAREPDPAYFPKYADQLYSLRKPQNDHDYYVLTYLSKFYDIWQ